MSKLDIKYVLIGLFLLGFLICLSIPIYRYRFIVPIFDNMLNQVFYVFTPPLATMLAFIFSDESNAGKSQKNPYVSALAIFLSLAYVSGITIIMCLFLAQKIVGMDVLDMLGKVYPKTSFLISGILTYYFASRKQEPSVHA